MPRSDPPPPKKHAPPKAGEVAGRSSKPPASGAVLGKSRSNASDDIEITVEEIEVTLGDAEIGDSEVSGWLTPEPSEHERVTIAPPMPEREYVAKMMKDLPDLERIPESRAITPIRGLAGPPSSRPEPASHSRHSSVHVAPRISDPPAKGPRRTGAPPLAPKASDPTPPLTLDLSDSLLPVAVASPIQLPTFERPSVPKFDTIESAPEPAPSARPRKTLPSAQGTALGGIEAIQTALPSSEPARFSFGPAAGDALELVGVRAESVKPEQETATMVEVRDRFDVGDFSGALTLASKILETDPEHVDALLYAEHCRDVLKQMYISNLGGLRRVPLLAVSPEQLRWLALDHRAGFLLSLLDGRSSFDELLDVCGMPPFDAIRLLVQLLQQNVIRVI